MDTAASAYLLATVTPERTPLPAPPGLLARVSASQGNSARPDSYPIASLAAWLGLLAYVGLMMAFA
jgi:hypothetical protein